MLPSETQQNKNNDRGAGRSLFLVQQGCVCLKVMKKLYLFFFMFLPVLFIFFFSLSRRRLTSCLWANRQQRRLFSSARWVHFRSSQVVVVSPDHRCPAPPPTRHVEPEAKVSLNSKCIELPWRVKQRLAVLWRLLVFCQHPSKHFYSQHATLRTGGRWRGDARSYTNRSLNRLCAANMR